MSADAPGAFSQHFRIRYEECGISGTIRTAVYLRYLQELAFAHSAALGYPLTWYEANRLFWLVRRVQLVVHAPARYGEALTGTTQVVGMRRILARRHNTIRRTADGTPLATVVVDWIFTHEGVATARIPAEFVSAFPSLEGTVAPLPLEELDAPARAPRTPLRIRTSDCDPMGHANNAVYLDLFDDAIIRAGGTDATLAHPRTYDLQYRAAANAGADLRDTAWPVAGVWHYRLEDPNGVPYLHGRLRGGDWTSQADTVRKIRIPWRRAR